MTLLLAEPRPSMWALRAPSQHRARGGRAACSLHRALATLARGRTPSRTNPQVTGGRNPLVSCRRNPLSPWVRTCFHPGASGLAREDSGIKEQGSLFSNEKVVPKCLAGFWGRVGPGSPCYLGGCAKVCSLLNKDHITEYTRLLDSEPSPGEGGGGQGHGQGHGRLHMAQGRARGGGHGT